MEDFLDVGGDHGRRQEPAMEAGGGSEGGSTATPGFATTTEAREAAPQKLFERAHGVVGGARD